MEKYLKKLYEKFLKFYKAAFFNTILKVGIKVKKEKLKKIFENYEKKSFFCFLKEIKDIIYSKNIYDFLLKNCTEDWYLYNWLLFLKKEKIISLKRNGKITLLEKKLLNCLPKPEKESKIREIVEKKLKRKLPLNVPVNSLFEMKSHFEYDQLPISVSSALFLSL